MVSGVHPQERFEDTLRLPGDTLVRAMNRGEGVVLPALDDGIAARRFAARPSARGDRPEGADAPAA